MARRRRGASARLGALSALGCALCGLSVAGGLGLAGARGRELNFVGARLAGGRLAAASASDASAWRRSGGARPAPHARPSFGGRGGPPVQEPAWLGTAFFALILLSFIPGPWQIVLGPIIGLINLFYMFKFGLFLLAIVAVFGISWWFENTTVEGQCPKCGLPQRGPKGEPFGCIACGETLEAKDGVFVRYVKSGKVEGNAFDQLKDFATEAAAKASERPPQPGGPAKGPGPKGGGPRKSTEVVDVEVL